MKKEKKLAKKAMKELFKFFHGWKEKYEDDICIEGVLSIAILNEKGDVLEAGYRTNIDADLLDVHIDGIKENIEKH